MNDITFADLKEIYLHTEFDAVGDEGLVTVANNKMLQLLHTIVEDNAALDLTQIHLLDDPGNLNLGATVRVLIRAPSLRLGLLAHTFDDLLAMRKAQMREPENYFVVQDKIQDKQSPPHTLQIKYRAALQVVGHVCEAATYVDETREELVFASDSKVVVPLNFNVSDLEALNLGEVAKLNDALEGQTHLDQKLAILEKAVTTLVRPQAARKRISSIFGHLDDLVRELQGGYRLFASSFSYGKIQSEVEQARLDFVGKIHKTVVDIQGQILGIPVATIVVASQFKTAKECDVLFWTNTAVVAGAWIFFGLLAIAVVNQWMTLSVISGEVERQRKKLFKEYNQVGGAFSSAFSDLDRRVCWHRVFLGSIVAIGCIGALFATYAYTRVTLADASSCILG